MVYLLSPDIPLFALICDSASVLYVIKILGSLLTRTNQNILENAQLNEQKHSQNTLVLNYDSYYLHVGKVVFENSCEN